MYKRLLIASAGVLVVGVSGCTIGEDTTASNPSPAPSESPAATGTPAPTQSFNNPIVKEKDKKDKKDGVKVGKGGDRVPGLLQSTDPAERAKQVQAKINKGGKDPFAGLPPIISFKTPAGNTASATEPKADGTASSPAPAPAPAPTANVPTPTRRPAIPSFPKPQPKPGTSTPNTAPEIPALPPLPEPTLAKAVEVTGVVLVRGVPQAIVKAPNEPTSRYVQAGQRLSNGQILVKRIEMNGGSDPVVILEQNGVEVARTVGDKGSTPTASALTSLRFA